MLKNSPCFPPGHLTRRRTAVGFNPTAGSPLPKRGTLAQTFSLRFSYLKVMNLLALTFALGAALCWATDQTLGKLALRWLDVSVFNAIRPSLMIPLLAIFGLATHSLSYPGLLLMSLAALVGVISWFVACELYFYLMNKGAAHRVLPIGNSHPVWGVIAAVLLLGEEPTYLIFASAALVVIGGYFLMPKGGGTRTERRMIPLALLVAIMWGAVLAPMKFCFNEGMTEATFLLIAVGSAAVACNIAMGIRHLRGGIRLDRKGLGISALSAFLAFFLGQLLFLRALKMEQASVLAPIAGCVVPFGFLLSVLLLGERPSARAVIGMTAVFLGVLLAAI